MDHGAVYTTGEERVVAQETVHEGLPEYPSAEDIFTSS